MLISYTVCDKCFLNQDKIKNVFCCEFCGELKNVFYSYKCVKMFGDYLYNYLHDNAKKFNSSIYVFAHNFKGYDGHFVMKDFFDRDLINVIPIMNGS